MKPSLNPCVQRALLASAMVISTTAVKADYLDTQQHRHPGSSNSSFQQKFKSHTGNKAP